MRRSRRRWHGAVLVAAGALLVGCTGDPAPAPTASAAATTPGDVAGADVAPVQVTAVVDGQEVTVEVGPLAVHDDAAVLRIASTAPAPTLRLALWHVFESISSPGPNGVRLVDVDAGTVTPVVRTVDDIPVSTRNGTPGGPATDASQEAAGVDVEVVHAAFPVPQGSTVDVLLPQVGWVGGVPVVPADAAGTLTVPPAEIVDGEVGAPVRHTLESYTEVLEAQVRTRETAGQVEVAVSSDVLFAFDSDALGPDADGALGAAAEQLAGYDTGTLTVEGHTDDQADDAYNDDLSQRRARTVATRLGEIVDLDGFAVRVEGRGEREPVVAGTGEAERAVNRRVEIVLEHAVTEAPATVVADGEPPEPEGPVGAGDAGVEVTDGDGSYEVRLPEVRRVGRFLVGALEVTNTGTGDLALGALSGGAWDARGSFDPQLQFAPTNVTLVSGGTRSFVVDYLESADGEDREPLSDRVVNGIGAGERRVVTVVWPDTGEDTVTVDVAPRFHAAQEQLQVAGRAPFRLTDVPVVED